MIFFLTISCVTNSTSGKNIEVEQPLEAAQTSTGSTAYLPTILKNHSSNYEIFGIEVINTTTTILDSAQNANLTWVRKNSLKWSDIQPNNNTEWNWAAVSELEQFLINANMRGMKVVLIVNFTPGWAQQYPGFFCGPVHTEKLADFANFMSEAVKRYSAPPFNVKYWELGNEPDVVWEISSPTAVYGCWAKKKEDDAFYGGSDYAEMLKAAYPAIKSADSEANVVLGGLLLDCDPTNYGDESGGGCLISESSLKPAKFFEGIINAGGGNYFDIVSFHGYAQMHQLSIETNPISFELNQGRWRTKGGVVQGKINYINEILDKYNVPRKPLLLTEGALLCETCLPDNQLFLQAKAAYIPWVFIKNWSESLLGVTWYAFDYPAWRNGAILGENQSEDTLMYQALSFLTSELKTAAFSSKLTGLPLNAAGFEFILSNGERELVLFSTNESSYNFPLSDNVIYVKNHLGENVLINDTDNTVTVKPQMPVYIRLSN